MRLAAIIVMISFGLLFDPGSARAKSCSKTAFCSGWYAVCKRTLPPGGSVAECDRRRASCNSSGCFHFNSPGPRCVSNPRDVALTKTC